MKISDLSWDEAREYIDNINNHLIIPIGTCEQHGSHLPLSNDTLIAEHMAKMLSEETGVLITPTVNYGVNSPEDHVLAGTTSISYDTLRSTISSITDWWSRQGIDQFIMLTYHGDKKHVEALSNIKDNITLIQLYKIDHANILEKQKSAIHAGEAETSIALYLYPDKVNMDRINKSPITLNKLSDDIPQLPDGYLGHVGYPAYATKEKGRIIVARMYDMMLEEYKIKAK